MKPLILVMPTSQFTIYFRVLTIVRWSNTMIHGVENIVVDFSLIVSTNNTTTQVVTNQQTYTSMDDMHTCFAVAYINESLGNTHMVMAI